ncbi:neuronal acetylcholine receptor subunit alpha-5 [Octopus bimaculoides]|nr:neuronal acetylcholine receptor subunit alpha-5 [Octopus bimaculoides]|eukprot:XP_014777761.1 PREDICTED: neuronal acetylcholine receptor subunit alpha-5-like isoform X1 [Octopus bimaculoides]
MDMYVNTARPVKHNQETMNITFTMTPVTFSIDETNRIMSLTSLDSLSWKDQLLKWDPGLQGGVKEVFLKPSDIWTPELELFNPAREPGFKRSFVRIIVSHDGVVLWIPVTKYEVQCFPNTTFFPFDIQICSLILGSEIYNIRHMDMNFVKRPIPSWNIDEHPLWKVERITTEKILNKCAGCDVPYVNLKINFHFTRHATVPFYTFLLPCFLLSSLSLVLFLLPSDFADKVTLGFGLFMAFFVLLLYLVSVLPPSQELPYFGIYLCFNLAILTLSTFLNVLVVNLANSHARSKIAKPLRAIVFDFFAPILCLKDMVKKSRSQYLIAEENSFQLSINNYCSLPKIQNQGEVDKEHLCEDDLPESLSPRSDYQQIEADIANIRRIASDYTKKLSEAESEKKVLDEWKRLAMVLNCLFFVCYLFLFGGSLIAYFLLAYIK